MSHQAAKTGVAMRGTHFPDEGGFPFFLPSLESFKSPYEVFGSSYGRTQLILLNLTGESLLLGKDQKAGAAAVLPAPPPTSNQDWPLHRAERHPFKS